MRNNALHPPQVRPGREPASTKTAPGRKDTITATVVTKAKPLGTRLAEQLRDAVTDGTFHPGDRLVERELCERWDVSRNSVREALRQLEAEGLIDLIPHRGPVVRCLSYEEWVELRELQLTLGCLVARRFAVNGNEDDMAQLESRILKLEAAMIARDALAIKSAKLAYFDAFAAGAKSPTLSDYVKQVNARLAFLWSSSLKVPGRPDENIHDLRLLLAMIRSRNPQAAEAAVIIDHGRSKVAALQGWHAFAAQQAARDKTPKSGKEKPS